ncbi:hypothetical protein [Rhodococcoides yunnanense]|uniref:hypothetical protein n=1 Tax=Rhodococcoides yunnanense TaxID=278209 RepID=UPI000AB702CF|nr:hypothetical protein [Rhodococcus yunnanensis]
MHLWQLDLVGRINFVGGRECKILTGIDDHSRFIVVAAVLDKPSGAAVCAAFVAAMQRWVFPPKSSPTTENSSRAGSPPDARRGALRSARAASTGSVPD